MVITPRYAFTTGSIDLSNCRLISIPSKKHADVLLCFEDKAHIPFASIKLHDSDRFGDAQATYEDAKYLGNEIANRWNTSIDAVPERSPGEESGLSVDDIALWADGVIAALGTEFADRVTDEESVLAGAIKSILRK